MNNITPEVIGTWVGVGLVLFVVIGLLVFIIRNHPVISFFKKSEKAASWMLASLDASSTTGASARKLSAAWAMIILATPPEVAWLVWAVKHGDWSLLPTVLTLVFGFVVTALGLTTVSGIIDKKNAAKADLGNKIIDNAADLDNKIEDKK